MFPGTKNKFKDVIRSYWVSFNQNVEEILFKYYQRTKIIIWWMVKKSFIRIFLHLFIIMVLFISLGL